MIDFVCRQVNIMCKGTKDYSFNKYCIHPSKYVCKIIISIINYILTPVGCLLTRAIKINGWDEYKTQKSYDNISDEKIKTKLQNDTYCEILIEVFKREICRVTEVSDSLKIDRETTRNILNWFVRAMLMRKFKITDQSKDILEKLKLAQQEIGKLAGKNDIRGAALKRLKNAHFYYVTMRGENFISTASNQLGLKLKEDK